MKAYEKRTFGNKKRRTETFLRKARRPDESFSSYQKSHGEDSGKPVRAIRRIMNEKPLPIERHIENRGNKIKRRLNRKNIVNRCPLICEVDKVS